MTNRCRVCDDNNGQHHYGTTCCPSCKGFFRRVYLSAKKLECYRGNSCVIRKGQPNACRACRYRKCVRVGMNGNDIRGKSDLSSDASSLSLAGTPEASTSFENSEDTSKPASPVVSEEMSLDEAVEITNFYSNLERYCENLSQPSIPRNEEDDLINQMFSCSVSELLERVTPQCPRFDRVWKPYEALDVSNFLRSWARSIVHFLDFASHIPSFNKLSLHDKKVWFVCRMAPCSLLTMAFHTQQEMCSGLLFGCSNVFPYNVNERNLIQDQHLRAMFSSITDTLFTDVVHTMIHLKFNQRMFALVKANVFYFEGMAPTMMTQHGRELMAKEKERHRSALIRLLTKDVQDLDVGMDLVMQTEQLMGCIESTAIFFDREVQYLDFLGLPIVKKNMFIECHIRKIPDIDD